ncbi:MAG: hypothetical protein LBK61_08885 [Spirochaetaceae bacterium]|nr:hypothetical protein [Spirochaetaceae bacterium]
MSPYGGVPAPVDCPAGGVNPQGFHPFFSHPIVKPLPRSGRKNSGMAGRIPPYDGGSLPGAKTRRVFIPS